MLSLLCFLGDGSNAPFCNAEKLYSVLDTLQLPVSLFFKSTAISTVLMVFLRMLCLHQRAPCTPGGTNVDGANAACDYPEFHQLLLVRKLVIQACVFFLMLLDLSVINNNFLSS